jgi:hypothetical protein
MARPKKGITVEYRFWNNVDKSTDGCWLWQGWLDSKGYGAIRVNGSAIKAHRLSYELHRGTIPDGLFVCHTCDVPRCVNPDHLFLGTAEDNVNDMMAKGRHSALRGSQCWNAKLTEQDVLDIRRLYAQGNISTRALGKKYGVTKTAILWVIQEKNWRHL